MGREAYLQEHGPHTLALLGRDEGVAGLIPGLQKHRSGGGGCKQKVETTIVVNSLLEPALQREAWP